MKKHILAIDDESDIRDLLREVLTIKGYRVSTAGTAEQAKKMLKEDPAQLIILDFQIEQGDGFVLIEDIKRLAPNIPILLLTGSFFDRDVVREIIEKKVTRYLDKTESLSTIVAEIERLLEDVPAASERI
jgi:two-component system, OmpR family, response regulator